MPKPPPLDGSMCHAAPARLICTQGLGWVRYSGSKRLKEKLLWLRGLEGGKDPGKTSGTHLPSARLRGRSPPKNRVICRWPFGLREAGTIICRVPTADCRFIVRALHLRYSNKVALAGAGADRRARCPCDPFLPASVYTSDDDRRSFPAWLLEGDHGHSDRSGRRADQTVATLLVRA